MTKGCIQGSLYGLTFWNLILDLSLEIELPSGCYMEVYADDVVLLVEGKTWKLLKPQPTALSLPSRRGDEASSSCPVQRRHDINFTPGCKTDQLQTGCKLISILPHIKLLGAIIDRSLNFMNMWETDFKWSIEREPSWCSIVATSKRISEIYARDEFRKHTYNSWVSEYLFFPLSLPLLFLPS